jgi:formylglycine-generating enzyme required for sulfatase activity
MVARFILPAVLIVFGGFPGVATAAEIFKDCSVCPSMVKLPPGKFLMGTAEDEDHRSNFGDEMPQHTVTFKKPFAFGQYPVTRGEFAAFVRETGHDPRECFNEGGQTLSIAIRIRMGIRCPSRYDNLALLVRWRLAGLRLCERARSDRNDGIQLRQERGRQFFSMPRLPCVYRTGWVVSTQCIRPLRHVGKCLAVDCGLLRRQLRGYTA